MRTVYYSYYDGVVYLYSDPKCEHEFEECSYYTIEELLELSGNFDPDITFREGDY